MISISIDPCIPVYACLAQGLMYPLRLFAGSDPSQGELQAFVNSTWRPVCSQQNMNSVTANAICQSLGCRIATRTFNYTYSGVDAAFDVIYCNGISNDCDFTPHTQGQLCQLSETKGIGCSNGKQSNIFVL